MKKLFSGVGLILIAGIFWGTAGVYVRLLGNYDLDPIWIVFLRAFFTVIILGGYLLFHNPLAFRIRLKDLWLFAAAGIFSIVLFNYCYYRTMALSSLAVAAVLLYTAPFFVLFISVPLFHEKFTLQKTGACVMAFIGCMLVSGISFRGLSLSPICLGFGLLTGFGYALYTVFSELLLKRHYSSETITFYTFVFAVVGTVPLLGNSFWRLFTTPTAVIPLGALPIAAAMGLFNTVLPYVLYTRGLKTVAPDRAPIFATVEPVVATLTGLFYGEFPAPIAWIGIVLVIGSVLLLNLKSEKTE